MNPSTKPVILIVDPEADASGTVEQLVARYSHDYTIVVRGRPGRGPPRSPVAGVRSRLRRTSLDPDRCFGHVPLRTVSGGGAVGRPVGGWDSCIRSRQLVTFDPDGDLRCGA